MTLFHSPVSRRRSAPVKKGRSEPRRAPEPLQDACFQQTMLQVRPVLDSSDSLWLPEFHRFAGFSFPVPPVLV